MTIQRRVWAEMTNAPGSARDLAERTGLTEKQVRGAIDRLREAGGFEAVLNRDGLFVVAGLGKGER